MSITIYLGRHGETDLNSEEKLRGWKDEKLNEDGIREAKEMGIKMARYPIDRIYCSDLDRADHTAQIVAKAHGLRPISKRWFRPINFGEWNGQPIKAIKDKMQQLLDKWKTDPETKAPGGESFEDFQNRNLEGLHAVVNSARDKEEIMIVAHLRNCLLFWALAKNGEPLEGDALDLIDDKHYHQDSGKVSKFVWDGSLEFKGKI
jgi:broad specificity phosphatase PhoE